MAKSVVIPKRATTDDEEVCLTTIPQHSSVQNLFSYGHMYGHIYGHISSITMSNLSPAAL